MSSQRITEIEPLQLIVIDDEWVTNRSQPQQEDADQFSLTY